MSTITATIVQDSRRAFLGRNTRITTFVLEYPRYIHAEVMTHRVFSRNAASSRAIPVSTLIQHTIDHPVTPLFWGKNQSGMVADEELDAEHRIKANKAWRGAAYQARRAARVLADLGVHKQIANRVLEPFQHIRTLVTATEFANFFALRTHKDAQPEIRELARRMWEAYQESVPMTLGWREWHVPFVERLRLATGQLVYKVDGVEVSWREAVKISASAAAQTSYRKEDLSLDKADNIFNRLVTARPVHASPFEHPARAKLLPFWPSRNFRGFRQYRTFIDGETVTEFRGSDHAAA